MLEGLVAGLLNRFLGMYVKNFDPAQLKVGIWSGDVKLRDLALRREALDQLKLPIDVVEGHLGALTLTIPWSNLGGAPVKVLVEDVFLLASPREEAQYDEEEEARRRQRLKMERLDSAELLKERSREGLSAEEQKRTQSFTESLVTTIADNLQVTVRNMHVRYEDAISAPGHPFALGVTLDEFSAVSCDGAWKPVFVHDPAGSTRKLATLGALAVYWDTDAQLLGPGREVAAAEREPMPREELVARFKRMIARGTGNDESVSHQFILRPVNGRAKVELDKTGDVMTPKIRAKLLFDEIGLVLDDQQYRDALMMADLFHYFVRHQEYKKYQPKGVTPREDPRAWLRFAGDAVLGKIHERNRRWTWDYLRERRDDRRMYISLFKKRKQGQTLTADESEALGQLERKLEYEDLRFWRSLARNELKKENAEALRAAEEQQKQNQQDQQQGWIAWVWGGGSTKAPETTADAAADATENTRMTEEQRRELYEAIDWDEKAALAAEVEVPREAVAAEVEASLGTGSFTLRRDPAGAARDLLSLHFDGFRAKGQKRTDSFLTEVSLGGLRVRDGTTPDTLFPEVVRVKGMREGGPEASKKDETEQPDSEDPLFWLQLEQNPLDGRGDVGLRARLKPLEIVWNPNLVVGVAGFLRPPERHMESITALMETAGATVEGLREQTRAGLEFALEEPKTVDAQLDLQAPLIVVPQSVTAARSTCLVLDAGHISVRSELADRGAVKDKEASGDLESLMYDRFLVKLTSTQLLIGPSAGEAKEQLTGGDHDEQRRETASSMHIVEEISVDLVVEMSILPKAPNLTRLRVSGHLPVLHAAVSDAKYKSLMGIIDVAVPRLGEDGSGDGDKASPRIPDDRGERRASQFLQFSPPKTSPKHQAIVMDDDSSGDAGSDSSSDHFEDAKDDDDGKLGMQQRSFEFRFAVDRLQGSLYRSEADTGRERLLAELVAEGFALEFYRRRYDMVAEVSLASVAVEDFVDARTTGELKSIVSSGDVEDRQQQRALVRVRCVRVSKESPEFMPVYEGVETTVEAAVSTINLVVTRKTLLTLLDFILATFGSNNTSSSSNNNNNNNNTASRPKIVTPAAQSSALRVKVDLKSIRLILNNDGIRLATLSFNQADVGVFMLGQTMRVYSKLGDLGLVDDVNQGVPATSPLRQLITIQGDDLADFRYETLDRGSTGFDSSVYLRAGSIQVNFVEEPFRKIVDFLVKFGQMQAIYNAARRAAASQANQLQQGGGRVKLDVVVETPIVVFRGVQPSGDLVTAYLGQIYVQTEEGEDRSTMKISAGIRNIRLTSLFHYDEKEEEKKKEEKEQEELELIDHVDVGFDIVHAESSERPDVEVRGSMTDFYLRLTQQQVRFLLALSRSVPAVFAGDAGQSAEEAEQDVDTATLQRARGGDFSAPGTPSIETSTSSLSPELRAPSTHTTLDLVFSVQTVGLELMAGPGERPVGDAGSLGRFSLEGSRVKARAQSDGSGEGEVSVRAFSIHDSRPGEANKFRRVMAASRNTEAQQLMASVSATGGQRRDVVVVVAVDSPRVIFALDYLFALQSFVGGCLGGPEGEPEGESEESPSAYASDDVDSAGLAGIRSPVSVSSGGGEGRGLPPLPPRKEKKKEAKAAPTGSLSFRFNVVDAQLMLIANPLSASSEAIVLGAKQVLLSRQQALAFQAAEVGMFLCRMDRLDGGEGQRLRIVDDFSVQLSVDGSRRAESETGIHVEVEPLVLRLSLRDVLLATQILARASAGSEASSEAASKKKGAPLASKSRAVAAPAKSKSSDRGAGKSVKSGKTSVDKSATPATAGAVALQELTATVDGIRVVVIGDVHELPILDVSIDKFTATASNWSSDLHANVALDAYANVYNFAKSAWEPLLEPWQLGVGVARDGSLLSVDITSQRSIEVTVTTATMALASSSLAFLARDQDVLTKPRRTEAPYRIKNYTGFDVTVEEEGSGHDRTLHLADGQEAPWSVESWERMRENLLAESATAGSVAVRLEGSGFDAVRSLRFSREGEFLYGLKPKAADTQHRLLVEVKLGGDSLKHVTLRSPLAVENATQIPVELGVYDAREGHLLKVEKIPPGESRPAPVGAAYLKSLLVRPDSGFGYGWSAETLWWRDLLKRPARTVVCKGEGEEPFYFAVNAVFDKGNPLSRTYPHMRIKISAPMTLENLLPHDFKYRIYDKNTQKDWSNFLRRGGVSPVHVVELSHLLLLSADMQDTAFRPSEFAVVNPGSADELRRDDFRREPHLVCRDPAGPVLHLKLHYQRVPDSGGAFCVAVYSPYVILNKTGLDVGVRGGGSTQTIPAGAGAVPFSFRSDDHKNRASLRVGGSEWSKSQSFDAVGSTAEVVLQHASSEIHVGIVVEPGGGKYKMTRVVTLAPRFVLRSRLDDDLDVREPSSSSLVPLPAGALLPLHFLQQRRNAGPKQLCLCFSGAGNQWSAPFNISDLGTTHVKLARAGQRQRLVRVDVLMEDATIFLHLSIEPRHWPFSVRNESDTEFTFYQANPNAEGDSDDEDEYESSSTPASESSPWRPVRYRLPPRSIMPYAWDFPAAKHRELCICAAGRERHVKLAEIGNQLPLKLGAAASAKVIDINVAADGPTQTLILSNYKASKSLYRQKTGSSTTTTTTTSSSSSSRNSLEKSSFEAKELGVGVTLQAQLRLSGVGVSLVSSATSPPRELAYVTLRGIHLRYAESPLYQTVSLAVEWIQIDNQLHGGLFPIVLYPSVVPKRSPETEAHPSLHAMVSRVRDDSYGVQYIKYATVLLQQMTLDLDEDFVYAVLDFSRSAWGDGNERSEDDKLCDETLGIPEPRQQNRGQDFYLEVLNIQPMQLDLSFMRTERVNAEATTSSRNPLMFFFNVLTMAIGNVNDAPVRLNGLLLENVRVSMPVLAQNVANHYSQGALSQIHNILGSADFLGNPVGLFNNISSGLTDVFYEPYQGLIVSDRPEDFGIALARGAGSLVKKSVFGLSDSFSKFTGSFAKGLAAATMDRQFQDRRRIARARNRPRHALYGLGAGANSLLTSVASGVGGLARKPLEGAEREGALGFFKGMGKGVVGLATKPAIGVLDLASNVSEGIRNTTTVFDGSELDRVRLPRFVPADGVVRPYSQREALGQSWLRQADDGRYQDEQYIAHLEVGTTAGTTPTSPGGSSAPGNGNTKIVVVTYARILLLRSGRRLLTTEWDVPLRDVQTVARERTGLALTLRGGTNGPFIPVGDESGRAFLYRMVAVAVEEFNRRFRWLG